MYPKDYTTGDEDGDCYPDFRGVPYHKLPEWEKRRRQIAEESEKEVRDHFIDCPVFTFCD